jgi:hypothetical protein
METKEQAKQVPTAISIGGILHKSSEFGDWAGYFPNARCNKCYGRGWIHLLIKRDERGGEQKFHEICRCVIKDKTSLSCGIRWKAND